MKLSNIPAPPGLRSDRANCEDGVIETMAARVYVWPTLLLSHSKKAGIIHLTEKHSHRHYRFYPKESRFKKTKSSCYSGGPTIVNLVPFLPSIVVLHIFRETRHAPSAEEQSVHKLPWCTYPPSLVAIIFLSLSMHSGPSQPSRFLDSSCSFALQATRFKRQKSNAGAEIYVIRLSTSSNAEEEESALISSLTVSFLTYCLTTLPSWIPTLQ